MENELTEAIERYTAQAYRYGRSDKTRIRDAQTIADRHCQVLPKVREALRSGLHTLENAVRAGIFDWSEEEVEKCVQDHATCKLMRDALTLLDGGPAK